MKLLALGWPGAPTQAVGQGVELGNVCVSLDLGNRARIRIRERERTRRLNGTANIEERKKENGEMRQDEKGEGRKWPGSRPDL